MAKLVAGVKSFKSVSYVSVPVNMTQYRTSNGRTYSTADKANKAQERINFRETSIRLANFLQASGVATPSCRFMVTTHALAKALSNPKFARSLAAVAG
jgi:hypothetical protein